MSRVNLLGYKVKLQSSYIIYINKYTFLYIYIIYK